MPTGSGQLYLKCYALYTSQENSKDTCPRYDKALYKQRHKIENMFGRIKDWRQIAMRYDRCAHTFFSFGYPRLSLFSVLINES